MILITVLLSGCGDKFAKEKEAITKAEQAAMAMKLPELVAPYAINKPSKEDWDKYRKAFKELLETETKILAEMQKSDAKIAEMEKTASESEKKDLKAFKDKIQNVEDFITDVEYNYSNNSLINTLLEFLEENKNNFYTNETEKDFIFYKNGKDIKIPKGMKINRALKFFFDN